jgi:hydroxylamine dehydrogenase
VCADCHDAEWSGRQLATLDAERKRAWPMLYSAERLLKQLRSDGLLYPNAGQRPPYPLEREGPLFSRERIGYFEGQASAFYNVSPIERDYFEMWYFANLGAYKGAAHGALPFVERGHAAMAASLEQMRSEAQRLRSQSEAEQTALGQSVPAGPWWREGAYTDYNREHN